MRVTVVHNPEAGYGSLTKGRLLEMLEKAGYEPDYWPMNSYSQDVVPSLAEMMVVVGGDGTVRKVASDLVGMETPIAIIPQGTANNISRSLGWSGDAADIMERWKTARTVAIDAGIARGPWGKAYFFEAAGMGLFAYAMPELSIYKKQTSLSFEEARDELQYDLDAIREALGDIAPHPWSLTLDGEDFSGAYLIVEAMNVASFGPGLRLASSANPHDGLLDVVLVGEEERRQFERVLAQNGDQRGQVDLRVHQCRSMTLQWDGDAIHADDNVWPQRYEWEEWSHAAPHRVSFSVEPEAVRFLSP